MTAPDKIEMRELGQTGIRVSPIGLGVMQFSGAQGMYRMMMPDIPQQEKNKIIQAALDGGINWFDTAELYGSGRSEQSLAAALKAAGKQNDEVVVCTKWWPLFRTARSIPRTIDERLRFLDGYAIDLYMVHNSFSFSSVEAEMHAMADLVEAAKIRSVGVSNFNAAQMERAQSTLQKRGLSLAVNQVHYSLLHRKIEHNGVLQAAKDLGVTIVCWGPLGSGLLSGKHHRNPEILAHSPPGKRLRLGRAIENSRPVVEELEKLAEKYKATPAQVALNWLIHFNGETVVAIPGASKVKQAAESAGAMSFKLNEEELAHLDEVSQVVNSQ
jgi:aryl-alcohol dehydrogenase-like predicted oxidoreductase